MAYEFKKLTRQEFQDIAVGVNGEFDRVWTVCEAAVADAHKTVYYDNYEGVYPDLDLTTAEGKLNFMKRGFENTFLQDNQETIAYYLDDYLVYLETVTIIDTEWYMEFHLIGEDANGSKAWWYADTRKAAEKAFYMGLGSVTKTWHGNAAENPTIDDETDGKKYMGYDVDAADVTIHDTVTWFTTDDYIPYTYTWPGE